MISRVEFPSGRKIPRGLTDIGKWILSLATYVYSAPIISRIAYDYANIIVYAADVQYAINRGCRVNIIKCTVALNVELERMKWSLAE